MDIFEIANDPDSGLPTVRVKRELVVLTKDEDRIAAERIKEIIATTDALRALCADLLSRLRTASEVTDMAWLDGRLEERARNLGVPHIHDLA